MIRRYMPVENSNPKRSWPCRAVSGEIVMVQCGKITQTTEDLTTWVRSGLLCEFPPIPDVPSARPTQSIAQIAPPPAPVVIPRTTSESVANAFSDALAGVFQKAAPPAPVAPPVVVAPLVVAPVASTEDFSVVGNESFATEPAVEDAPAADETEEAAPDTADANDYSTLKRSALWALVVERGLDSGREYRMLTKGDLIFILNGGADAV